MNRIFSVILLFFMVSCTNSSCSAIQKPDDRELKEINLSAFPGSGLVDNNVVAHRGLWIEKGYPDNSLAALKAAISIGCFASECDIHITSDDRVVVFHDDTFRGLILKDTGYEELCAAGTLSNGEKIPLLEEFIDVILRSGTTKLWIDVKSMPDIHGGNEYSIKAARAAARIVHEKHATNFVEFIAGREEVLTECISAAKGEWACGYMNPNATPASFHTKGYKWANLTVNVLYRDQELINKFRDYQIRVSTYNADSEEQMTWFLAQKFYAVCTNYPVKMLKLVREKR